MTIFRMGNGLWYKGVVLENTDECRTKRTGSFVDSREFSCVCPNFAKNELCMEGRIHYYCMPKPTWACIGNRL
ncbi:hypothetical protein [Thermocrinis minervae]|uniref:hypothetical protein n=1 Tax=Thermocrinis minervae TaxID=381751 RepID=UPI0009A75D6C|nr:hypothetical protein [Thermocrinis minervae]